MNHYSHSHSELSIESLTFDIIVELRSPQRPSDRDWQGAYIDRDQGAASSNDQCQEALQPKALPMTSSPPLVSFARDMLHLSRTDSQQHSGSFITGQPDR